jgi:type II secretory pathway component PulJ
MNARASVARIRTEGGFALVSVLLAMLIVAVLYFGYFSMQNSMSKKSVGIAAIDASKSMACRTQRQQIERDITFWSASHSGEEPSLAALQKDGLHVPTCPEGGHYSITTGSVHCSVHG